MVETGVRDARVPKPQTNQIGKMCQQSEIIISNVGVVEVDSRYCSASVAIQFCAQVAESRKDFYLFKIGGRFFS